MAIQLRLPFLILASLLAAGQVPAAAAATAHHATPATIHAHLHHHGHGHHHRSPPTTATDTSPLRALDPFTPVATQPASGEEATASAGAAADPELRHPPQPPSPPPSSFPAADLVSRAPRTEEAGPSSSYHVGLQNLAKVLASVGYNEMAHAAALLPDTPMLLSDSPVLATSAWQGPITVFAAPDALLQAACPWCSHRQLLLRHLALGYFSFAELAAARPVKLLSASGYCIDVDAEPGPFDVHHPNASLYADGVEVSRPSLYDDGRYVVHGLDGIVPALSNNSCVEGTRHRHRRHHLSARSPAASIVRTMIREAMSRLRERGFGFVALAMRFDLAELEKLANLTVFALDDHSILSGLGDGYASAVRFHIVPGHRLTRADLLRLPGARLPTLAGEDQKLVITHDAGSATGVLVNNVPVKNAVLIDPHLAVHSIGVPFPRLALASSPSVAVGSAIPMRGTCGVEVIGGCTEDSSASDSELVTAPPADKPAATTTTPALPHPYSTASAARPHRPVRGGPLHVTQKVGGAGVGAHPVGGGHGGAAAAAVLGTGAAAAIAVRRLIKKKRKLKAHRRKQADLLRRRVQKQNERELDPKRCRDCGENDSTWTVSCCGFGFCSLCVVNGYIDTHVHIYRRRGRDFKFCGREGHLVPIVEPKFDPVHGEFFFTGEEKNDGHYMKVKTFVNLAQLQARQLPKRLLVWVTRSDGRRSNALQRSPAKKTLSAY